MVTGFGLRMRFAQMRPPKCSNMPGHVGGTPLKPWGWTSFIPDLPGKEKMAKPISSELVLRVYSALILVAVSLTATYAGSGAFAALIFCFTALMGWEWGRVVRGRNADSVFVLQTFAAGVCKLSNASGLSSPGYWRDSGCCLCLDLGARLGRVEKRRLVVRRGIFLCGIACCHSDRDPPGPQLRLLRILKPAALNLESAVGRRRAA